MERTTLVCDVCGAEQGKENHWWVVFLAESQLILTPLEKYDSSRLKVSGFEDHLGLGLQHLCGAECATRRVSEFMSGTLEAAAR